MSASQDTISSQTRRKSEVQLQREQEVDILKKGIVDEIKEESTGRKEKEVWGEQKDNLAQNEQQGFKQPEGINQGVQQQKEGDNQVGQQNFFLNPETQKEDDSGKIEQKRQQRIRPSRLGLQCYSYNPVEEKATNDISTPFLNEIKEIVEGNDAEQLSKSENGEKENIMMCFFFGPTLKQSSSDVSGEEMKTPVKSDEKENISQSSGEMKKEGIENQVGAIGEQQSFSDNRGDVSKLSGQEKLDVSKEEKSDFVGKSDLVKQPQQQQPEQQKQTEQEQPLAVGEREDISGVDKTKLPTELQERLLQEKEGNIVDDLSKFSQVNPQEGLVGKENVNPNVEENQSKKQQHSSPQQRKSPRQHKSPNYQRKRQSEGDVGGVQPSKSSPQQGKKSFHHKKHHHRQQQHQDKQKSFGGEAEAFQQVQKEGGEEQPR